MKKMLVMTLLLSVMAMGSAMANENSAVSEHHPRRDVVHRPSHCDDCRKCPPHHGYNRDKKVAGYVLGQIANALHNSVCHPANHHKPHHNNHHNNHNHNHGYHGHNGHNHNGHNHNGHNHNGHNNHGGHRF